MKSFRENPEGNENRQATRQNERESFALKMQAAEPRASIFTEAQERQLRTLKAQCPFRIVWGEIIPDTQEFNAYASFDRRAINKSLRAGNLVATIG